MDLQSVPVRLVSDFVCPFCMIGLRRLEVAAKRQGATLELRFEPFQLEPLLAEEGSVDLRERLKRKYGNLQPMFDRVEALAKADGIDLDLSRVTRAMSTLRAHTLVDFASEHGVGLEVGRALFAAYFLEGCDLTEPSVLTGAAAAGRIPEAEALAAIADKERAARVRERAEGWAARGIGGVPLAIVGESSVAGAQNVEVFERAIQAALAG